MKQYHPIRREAVAKMQVQREEFNAAELQKELLSLLTSGAVDPVDLKRNRSYREAQDASEGLNWQEAEPWRKDVAAQMEAARSIFIERGKNIFDMTLVSPMFRRVDVDDLKINATPLPYPSIYMHFGLGGELSFNSDFWIEGAYIRELDDDAERISITFVCNHPDWQNAGNVPLGVSQRNETMAATVSISRTETVSTSISARKFVGEPTLIASDPVMIAAMRMAVNGLLFLNIPEPDVEFDFDDVAPRELVAMAATTTGSKQAKAVRRLEDLGYVRVNFCGRQTAKAQINTMVKTGTGRAVAEPHWRRGHWRRVAVGKGRMGREWRLIQPTVVNMAQGKPVRGRVHVVQPLDRSL